MNMNEFNQVKGMTYLEYCDYLQKKYGISEYDYMTKSFNKNKKCSRTKDGLIVHHLDEDKMIMLSTKEIAERCPFEWQTKEHLVFCDMLEHLLLHVLICYYPSPKRHPKVDVGIGGVVNYIVPELNDMYSGWETKQEWRKNLHDKVRDDEEVYLEILQLFVLYAKKEGFRKRILHSSLNEQFGGWRKSKNKALYKKIDKLWSFWTIRKLKKV